MSDVFRFTNKEASAVLCSVVKNAGNGRARKKCRGKHETQSSVFPLFTTERSTVEASLFNLFYDKEFNNFPKHSLTKLYFPKK